MKKAMMIAMTCLILVSPVFAQGPGSPNVRVETINLVPTATGLYVELEAQVTKITCATLKSSGEIFRVHVEAPGMVLYDECGGYMEEFLEFEVQVDSTYGHKGLTAGKLQLSSFTGQGNLTLVAPSSFNGDQPGELLFPMSVINSVKVLYQGKTMASGTF